MGTYQHQHTDGVGQVGSEEGPVSICPSVDSALTRRSLQSQRLARKVGYSGWARRSLESYINSFAETVISEKADGEGEHTKTNGEDFLSLVLWSSCRRSARLVK